MSRPHVNPGISRMEQRHRLHIEQNYRHNIASTFKKLWRNIFIWDDDYIGEDHIPDLMWELPEEDRSVIMAFMKDETFLKKLDDMVDEWVRKIPPTELLMVSKEMNEMGPWEWKLNGGAESVKNPESRQLMERMEKLVDSHIQNIMTKIAYIKYRNF